MSNWHEFDSRFGQIYRNVYFLSETPLSTHGRNFTAMFKKIVTLKLHEASRGAGAQSTSDYKTDWL